jgi:hypothetical protein
MNVETCETCRFFKWDGEDNIREGHCRRYPPTALRLNKYTTGCVFPSYTAYGMWCGEYKSMACEDIFGNLEEGKVEE